MPGHSGKTVRKALLATSALVAAGMLMSFPAYAGPAGGVTVGGSAVINTTGSSTVIHQSTDRAIIHWDSFNVGASERVDFQQPSRGSITVNRIGGNAASQINGKITANGNIMLLNPNGVLFGAGSQVDVGGLVASTSDLESDADFLAGGPVRLTKPGNPGASVINKGTITVGQAGLAGFIAPNVENQGTINAKLGRVVLASGDINTIDMAGDGLIQIAVSDDVLQQSVKNGGIVAADGGSVTITAAAGRNLVASLIDNEGTIRADTYNGSKGKINIGGSSSTVQNTGTISAKGDTAADGGKIDISDAFVSLGGTVSADGANGGDIGISAGTLSLADTISAKGLAGTGGHIILNSQTSWETSTSSLNADGTTAGGSISDIADQQIISSGSYSARGLNGLGGSIDISGWSTKLLTAHLDASGKTGGGTIRLGGPYQGGKGPDGLDDLAHANYMIMDGGTTAKADATGTDGKGGTVILWSDDETIALGDISAMPGTVSGDGGLVEVSSAQTPEFGATVETGRTGRPGTVLLDPKNILISDFTFNSSAIILGYGYGGGRTNQNTNLDNSDYFGYAVSLDGNRMAVGAYGDDGFNNAKTNTGAVYLFSFADADFSGATLEGIIGSGYTGGKNIDLPLDNNDQFGTGVSLDGKRLAVGAYADDGSANSAGDSGAVYLFTFADDQFSGGALAATIGKNYTGGKNFNVANLAGSDQFGISVALDSDRLAVGARYDDGSANNVSDSGAVYLFTFTDDAFNGAALAATIGAGYTGGKNISLSNLEAGDHFGNGVSLDGKQLIVGAPDDDGFGNAVLSSGAAYLFNFTDDAFSGGALQSVMGKGYTGGKNVDVASLEASDIFGYSVSLDNGRFAIGAYGDDGYNNIASAAGAVYLYTVDDAAFSNIAQQSILGYGYISGKNLNMQTRGLGGNNYFGIGVSLDGDRLVVGASNDSGANGTAGSSGATYAFTFSDDAFSDPTLQGKTGSGYIQGQNYSVPNLDTTSVGFGQAVSLDGLEMAVGNFDNSGFGNVKDYSGAVYLYTFSDDSFSDATLNAIIGAGYTGGNNYNEALNANVQFGYSVSLDNNRLAVGTAGTDMVYLYTFADTQFSNINLAAKVGYNPTGAPNLINIPVSSTGYFGRSVSLDGNRLAVGALYGDGSSGTATDSGTVSLFTFTDDQFDGGTLAAVIGSGFTGGKNISVSLDNSDYFGTSVALDGNRLAVGAWSDDGLNNTISNAGAVYLFTFSDDAFNGGALAKRLGKGYTGANDINLPLYATTQFGSAVALSGNSLFVGANKDPGPAGNYGSAGAVYRFDFSDAAFTGGTLGGVIGSNYTGVNDYDITATNANQEFFGTSLSVDGKNLVVGSSADGGYAGNAVGTGALYFFQYADTSYSGAPALLGMAGVGYGGDFLKKSISTPNIKGSDYFGWSVSLDGDRMAVGAPLDDGFNDIGVDRGAVYLYSFADDLYDGGILEGIIGNGYTGGKNINISLDNSDQFGSAVSLDGNRLAVGAKQDDGYNNTMADSGAVYLFNFADSTFGGGALAATIGNGYTGGKNINLTGLQAGDIFGASVSLDGNRIAIGAYGDDGPTNSVGQAGAVYLFNFADSAFTGGSLAATIGQGYTGGKNVSVANLGANDYFGSSVSLDGNMLAVGAYLDDGYNNTVTDSGAVYLYTFADSAFTGGTLQGILGYGYTGGKNINVSSLETTDWYGWSVSLDNNRLAVGSSQDDGYNNSMQNSGAAYLYSFSDNSFSGGTLQSTVGAGYTGGKNFDLGASYISGLNDYFGAVSLDGDRLLIGGYNDQPQILRSGSVAMLTFDDDTFSNAALVGMAGNGYVGGKSFSLPATVNAADAFGYSVSLNNNRLAIGAYNDDGFNNSLYNSGAVYLYSIPGGDYDAITFDGIIGYGYTGGKNINVSTLGISDQFGYAVSLDGNRLAVGAPTDDGASNAFTDAGAVYLFTFADNDFNGGALASTIGYGYTGGKNINVASLNTSDIFGYSVSLDGDRLAVGAYGDDGYNNTVSAAGAAYLFTFTDSQFNGGTLASTIGYGYTGGSNVDLSSVLGANDWLGTAVSLDGNRLAIGAQYDDGFNNAMTDAGAVYLFTFADDSSSKPILKGRMGYGYTDAGDYNVSSLFTSDKFGGMLTLDGTVMGIGALGDDGPGVDNASANYPSVFLYTFSDQLFDNPVLDSTVGYYYTGGKNIKTLAAYPSSVSIDSGVLVLGVTGVNDATNAGGYGGVYIYRDSLSPVSHGTSFGTDGGNSIGITSAAIAALLSTPQNVTLQASNDITVASPIFVNNGTGDGGTFTLQAGRSIFISAPIVSDNGDVNILANENLSTGVVNAQRDAGTATISMTGNGFIDAGTGSVFFRMDTGAGKTNNAAGDIVLQNVTASNIQAISNVQTGNILLNGALTATGTGDAIVLAAGANLTNNAGANALKANNGRWLIYADHSDYTDLGGLGPDLTAYKCIYGGSCSVTVPLADNAVLYQYGEHLLTISLNTSRTYGDANPDQAAMQAQYQYFGFEGTDDAGDLDVLPTATIAAGASATAGAGSSYAITFSGGSDDYYDYYFTDSLLTITKKDITASWNGPLTKTYGDANPIVSTGNFTYTGLANGQNGSVITASANYGTIGATTGAGTYDVGATFSATNYNVTNAPVTTLTIGKRDITADWTGTLTKTYGDANPAVSSTNFTYTGMVNGDTGSAVSASGDFGATGVLSDVGSYDVGGTFSSANYNVTNTPTTTLTITKRDITATVNDESRAYGDADPDYDWSHVTWTNLADGDTGEEIDTLTFTDSGLTVLSNAGSSGSVDIDSFSDNNYNLTSSTAGTLTVTKRDITATVDDESRAYGDDNPVLTWADVTWSNLANSQTGAVLDSMTIASSTATATSDAGTTHDIDLTDFSDDNYNLTGYTAGTLTITKRDITADVGAVTNHYGNAAIDAGWADVTWNNLANDDTGADLDSVTFSSPTATALSGAGTSHVLNIDSFSDNNYNLVSFTAGELDIDQAPLTLIVQSVQKNAQSANPAFAYSLQGLKNGDPGSVVSGVLFTTAATQSSPAGTYEIDASGGAAANYYIASYIPGTLTVNAVNTVPVGIIKEVTPLLRNNMAIPSTAPVNIYPETASAPMLVVHDRSSAHSIMVIPDDDVPNLYRNKHSWSLIAITESLKDFFQMAAGRSGN